MSDSGAIVREGLRLHNAGDLNSARAAYERALALHPENADALHLLGVIAHQSGDHQRGVDLIRKAIRKNSRVGYYYNNLGECWRALKQVDRATACYRRALRLDPQSADALANLGNVLKTQKRFPEAIEYYKKSLKQRPADPKNLANLASAYCEAGNFDFALSTANQAVQLAPAMFEGWLAIGIALRELGRNREAINALKKATSLKQTDLLAWNNLGLALQQVGAWKDAVNALQTAIKIEPDDSRAFLHLGNIWRDLYHFDRARACYEKALQLKPDDADAWNNLGLAVQDLGLFPAALRHFERSLALNPKSNAAWNNRAGVLRDMGLAEAALKGYRKAAEFAPKDSVTWNNIIFTSQFCAGTRAKEICTEARHWGDATFGPEQTAALARSHSPKYGSRIRIGYVSPDFRAHPVAFFLLGLLKQHDRSRFQVFCYATSPKEDEWTGLLRQNAEHWSVIAGCADDEAAEIIRRDRLDLLVDLSGHTQGNRLGIFARKPARFQATYLGYPGTTGLKTVDFRITDSIADPADESIGHYVEELLFLGRCAWCYTPPSETQVALQVPSTKEGGVVTFGCFNNYAKVSDETLRMWSEIMRRVARSRLMLKADPFGDPEFVEVTLARLRSFGIGTDRVWLRPRVASRDEHFGFYNQVDIALDTFPYHGTTTTCDALWMGVPVVTRRGERHSSRVGASLLAATSLPDLITGDAERYVDVASKIAQNRSWLSELRSNLRGRMKTSQLMDAAGLARSFESIVAAKIG
jgi:predicted O-linked N-acetylglucosamine transferase (SPINDLY family)